MKASGFAYKEPAAGFERIEYELEPGQGDAVVKIAGCGLCHTDVGFYYGDVSPRHELPLVLGHEISGTVVEGPADLIGRNVVIPAVMPCGECSLCKDGYAASCRKQLMPGNDGHGGFADHICVPARDLAVLPDDLQGYALADLSVIADAVTTPYQSVLRSGLKPGDVAIVVGVGGIGTYGVQIAKALGATVIAIDIDDDKLRRVSEHGADHTYNSKGSDSRTAKKAIKGIIKGAGLPSYGWKIFEMSGSASGQELAFNLIGPSATLAVVGFTMARIEVRLSNLMAFDARCFGNWGCLPSHYPAVIELVLSGKVTLKPFIKQNPLAKIGELFELAHEGKLTERAILTPE